jgi:hypothetical protein
MPRPMRDRLLNGQRCGHRQANNDHVGHCSFCCLRAKALAGETENRRLWWGTEERRL